MSLVFVSTNPGSARRPRSGRALQLAACLLALPAALCAQTAAHYAGVRTTVASVGSVGSGPGYTAVDSAGNVYIGMPDSSEVFKVVPTGPGAFAAPTVVESNLSSLLLGLTVDGGGNVYLLTAAASNHAITILECAAPTGLGTCNAPTTVPTTFTNGTTQDQGLGLAADAAGDLYVLVTNNTSGSSRVVVETLNGGVYTQTTPITGLPSAEYGIAVDSAGNLYITGDNVVTKETRVSASSYTATTVGSNLGVGGSFVGNSVAVDPSGDLYVSDINGTVVFKETPAGSGYTQTTAYAGFVTPYGVATDAAGHLYVANSGSTQVYEESQDAINLGALPVGTVSANYTLSFLFDAAGTIGYPAVVTQGSGAGDFQIYGIGNAEGTCHQNAISHTFNAGDSCTVILSFTPLSPGARQGAVQLINNASPAAGIATAYLYGTGLGPLAGFDSGTVSTVTTGASLSYPSSIAVAADGDLFFVDNGSCEIYRLPSGTTTANVIAGSSTTCPNSSPSGNGGLATAATFSAPWRVAVNGRGDLFIADTQTVRKIDAVTHLISAFAGNYTTGGHSPDGTLAVNALLNDPYAIAADGSGNLYLADSVNSIVQKVDALSGQLSTVAGVFNNFAGGFGGDTGPATAAALNSPGGLAFDLAGDLYIADTANNVVRKVAAGTGTITTIAGVAPAAYSGGAGSGNSGYSGDGGLATLAYLKSPEGLAVDPAGNVYIADTGNDVVRKVSAATGIITTAAGVYNGSTAVYTGDGGSAKLAGFGKIQDVAIDGGGNLYLADAQNHVIRVVAAASGAASLGSAYLNHATAALDVALTNDGNTALTVTALATPAAFNLNGADTTCTSSTTLAVGHGCVLGIEFLPVAAGAAAGTFALTDNVRLDIADILVSPTQTVAATGTGVVLPTTKTVIAGVPATLVAGGNLGAGVTVSLEEPNGTVVTFDTTTVTVTVTGPFGYSHTFTAPAVAGVATFNLSAFPLMDGGVYTATATDGALTASSAQTTVSDHSSLVTLALSSAAAAQGAPVTLTATATSGGSPAVPGQVSFNYTATVLSGSIAGSFGVGQLTSAGTSALVIRPGPGTYVITANFAGTGSTLAAASASKTLTITGPAIHPTETVIAAAGTPGAYTLTSTVAEFGSFPAPSGTVSFLDASNSNLSLATAAIDPTTFGYNPVPPSGAVLSNPNVAWVATADLNGDGIADLIALQYTNAGVGTVTVQLGLGGGLFGAAATYNLGAIDPYSLAIADVNGDGHPDVLVLWDNTAGTNGVVVLLGDSNGDGGLVVPSSLPSYGSRVYVTGSGSDYIETADLNFDGNPDLLIGHYGGNQVVGVLLGNGDGTFRPEVTYPAGGNVQGMAVADFNHDGIPDLAVTNDSHAILLLLGNGNGTFQAATTVHSNSNFSYGWLSAGSLRGNGVTDLVALYQDSPNTGGFEVLLGNNNGTFAAAVDYASPDLPLFSTLADTNLDGKLDLVANQQTNNSPYPDYLSILAGNGDGTFAVERDFAFSQNANNFAVADFNNDGLPDFVLADEDGFTPILLGAYAATATAAGVVAPGPGTQNVDASYAGDGAHAPSVSATVPLLPVLSTTALAITVYSTGVGTPVTLTATVGSTLLGPASSGTVSFYKLSGSVLLGTASVAAGTASFTTSALPAGYSSVYGIYSGSATTGGSTSASLRVFVGAVQSSTVLVVSTNAAVIGTAVTLTATGLNEPGATPLTPGQVSFNYQLTVNGVTLPGSFGTAQLTSLGTAAITVKPGAGTYVVTAAFPGTSTVGPSLSAPQTITIAGNASFATTNTLASSGTVGDYTLAATVEGIGLAPPSGTVSFLDTTTANSLVATAAIDPASAYSDLNEPLSSPVTDTAVTWVATGDFNNDGIPDIASVTSSGYLYTRLGTGAGAFGTVHSANRATRAAYIQVMAGDVNNDGKPDLIALSPAHTSVDVYLGLGTGLFTAPTAGPHEIATHDQPTYFATGDFNNDGNLDIAVVNESDPSLQVFLGAGNGTFTTLSPFTIGAGTVDIVVADFNSDGIPDLAMSNATNVTIYLGNGNGTFQAASQTFALPDGNAPNSIAAGSLRNNGVQDLVVGDGTLGGFWVYLGNNDGTFTAPAAAVGNEDDYFVFVGLVDVDGNGTLDLVNQAGDGDLDVYLGNGDGTFGSVNFFDVGNGGLNFAAADFNHDGLPDFITSDNGDGTETILLGAKAATATAYAVYALGTGTQNVKASYPGDATHAVSVSATVPLAISTQSASTTLLGASPSTVVFGGSVILTASVTPVPAGAAGLNGALVYGTVSFYSNGTLLGTGTVSSAGTASLTTTALAAGVDAMTATYSGSAALALSTSAALQVTVLTATTTTVSGPSASGSYAQPATLTATLAPTPTGSPTGTVRFYFGSVLLGTTPVSAGVATLAPTTLALGADAITAVYSGNALYATSTSTAAFVYTVSQAATATVLSSSNLAPSYGQAIALTATVAPASTDSPAGTVRFYQGSTLLGAVALSGQGTATLNLSTLVFGTDTVTAVYSGSTDFAGSTSSGLAITVAKATTATVVTSSTATPGYGNSFTLTATVAPATTDSPAGTVSFYQGTTLLGTSAANPGGVATLSVRLTTLGANAITASYSGSLDFGPSTSSPLSITVVPAATATVVTSSTLTPAYAATITLTATVAPASTDTPPGTVSFYIGSTLLGTAPLNSGGVATLSASALTSGLNLIKGVYSGSVDFAGSASGPLSVSAGLTTATVVTSSAATPGYGNSFTLTATVAPASTNSPAGTVSFYQGTTLLGTSAANPGGVATLSVRLTTLGANAITASYSGSLDFGPSTSNPLSITVVPAATATVVASSNLTPAYGATITLTATVAPASTDTPPGTVSFYTGSTLLGTAALNARGVASLSVSALTSGLNLITGVYSGSVDFAGSTSSQLSVSAGLTTATVVASSTPTPAYEQPFALTATVTPASTDTPAGTVSFYSGAALLGSSPVSAGGVATLSASLRVVGPGAITAAYSGSLRYASSTSAALSINVVPAATSTAVSSSNLAPALGQTVNLNATVTSASASGAGGIPGTVAFYSGSALLGSSPLAGGAASLSAVLLPLGPNGVTAVYSGSADFAGSASAALSVAVGRLTTTVTFSASPTTQLYDNPIILTAQVSSATAGAPSGMVTFLDGTTAVATATVGAGGQATYSDTALADGSHSLTAAYSGDTRFLPSVSSGAGVAITVGNLNLALGGDNNKSVVPGGAVTYNFPLSPVVTPTFIYSVALTATGLPPGATYTFSPSTIPAGSGTLPVAFTVQTAKSTAMLHRAPGSSRSPWFALIFGLLVPLAGAKRFRARLTTLPRMLLLLLFGALSLGLVAGLGGCGSGGFLGSPPGQTSYTITISATSGTLVRTSTVQLSLE
jgi:hypothetical protein